MKNIFSFFTLFLLCVSFGFSQILDPVKWSSSVEKINENEYWLITTATIDHGWHLYSQSVPDDGPIPTYFEYDTQAETIQLINDTQEPEGVTIYDTVFEMDIKYFEDNVVFKQQIKTNGSIDVVSGFVEFMVCDDKQCLAPAVENLTFSLSGNTTGNTEAGTTTKNIDNDAINEQLYGLSVDEIDRDALSGGVEDTDSNSENNASKTIWGIFGLGFLGGLLALLTPCVFPMIPLTVSFFTKQGESSSGSFRAVLYGFFILLVYLLLSAPFHLLDSINPDILNEISTNVTLNVVFFLIFLFFAFSFFGYYELTLPSSWTAKTTKAENAGGVLGIFFMALTLALVSFSCTGPILGSLLAGSLTSDGGAWQLTSGMAGFGVALGLPFTFFAMFPNIMNSLPKSGGWMVTVKVVLGFLELALAFKFLSNADLVAHWNLLKIEPFLIIWILVFAGLALYLFKKIRFPHDTPPKKLSFLRVTTGVLAVAFTLYLVSGFRYNEETKTFTSLKLLSGLAPPVGYSFIYPNDCPNNLNCFKDLKTGLAYAEEKQKPILLDFTGYACVNCRKMEEHVWSNPKIDKVLRDEVVLISLYVDDKKELPVAQQLEVNTFRGKTRVLETFGQKWAHFQTQFFMTNSQPYYVILTPDGKQVLNTPVGYVPDIDEYYNWLQKGIKNATDGGIQ